MTDLDREEQLLVSRARVGLLPAAGASGRVRRAIAAAVAAEAIALANSGRSGPGVRSAGGNGLSAAAGNRLSRFLLAAAIAGTGAAPSYWFGYRSGRRAAQVAAETRTSPPAPAATLAPGDRESPPPVLRPPASDARPNHGPISARAREAAPRVVNALGEPSSTQSLAKEVTALRAIERALREGEPALAFALLERLDREVPNGKLLEEREATAAMARCALGRAPFGVNLAEDFAARHPASVYRERVEATCARGPVSPKLLDPPER